MKYILLITISLFLFIGSCYYDSEENLYPQLSNSCDTVNITFSASVAPILSSNCLSCHSNSQAASFGGSIKLENYADVKIQATSGALYGSVSQSGGYVAMPKGGSKLEICKITTIKKWAEAGAPNN